MVPHATDDLIERRRSSSSHPPLTSPTKSTFPELSHDQLHHFDQDALEDISRGPSPRPLPNGLPPGMHSSERWPVRHYPQHNGSSAWSNGGKQGMKTRPGHQKSLSEAIHTVRTRKMSFSENAHEIAESLKAPVSLRLVLLCTLWYTTSILTNTSSKSILTALNRPVTLTIVQFMLVSFWCFFLSWLAHRSHNVRTLMPVLKNGIRKPSREIIIATLPLTAFQIGGHILNSDAMARIPVSTVHTIKGLSPLMTVLAYRFFFNIRYSVPTYLSLVPLTFGVIMACSASFAGNFVGLTYAFGSAVLFVTQNIVSKKIFNEAAKAEADGAPAHRRKPDKLNLLCYSSASAFIITCPIWLWSEGFSMAADYLQDGAVSLSERPGSLDHGRLAVEFFLNGTFHFSQSLVAFVLLGMVSPVTYSVASLIKRVVVIMFAIVWFGHNMTSFQGFGFGLTFLGLYLYDRTSDAAKVDRRAQAHAENRDHLLPLNVADTKKHDSLSPFTQSPFTQSPLNVNGGNYYFGTESANGVHSGSKGAIDRPRGSSVSPHGMNAPVSMPPGTKARETWNADDRTRDPDISAVR